MTRELWRSHMKGYEYEFQFIYIKQHYIWDITIQDHSISIDMIETYNVSNLKTH